MKRQLARNSLFVAIAITITFLLFQGCTESTLNTDGDQTTAEVQTSQTKYQQYIQEANSHYYQLAEIIPGFGGVYLEEQGTRLVIRATNLENISQRQILVQDIRNFLNEKSPGIGTRVEGGISAIDIKFEKADFKYTQLRSWLDGTDFKILDTEGVTFTSVSHKKIGSKLGWKRPILLQK